MSSADSAGPAHAKPPHPFLYFLLFLPFGATSGFITVAIGTLARKAGLSDEVIAGMIAMNILPHTWKVLWAPAVDTLWTKRGWYITTNLISSACIITCGFIPISSTTVGLITMLIFFNGLATTFVGMCTESLMAKLTPPAQRGAAGGWSQAGNVGGSTIGGLGLMLADNVEAPWVPFVAVGLALMLCSLVLFLIDEPPDPEPKPRFIDSMQTLGRDIWHLLIDPKRAGKVPSKWLFGLPPVFLYALSTAGILAIVLSLMPIGSGGAQNLFAVMAPDWHASDDLVSWSNGLLSGGSAIVGSVLGGKFSDKIDKRWAYALSGIALALCAFGMALAPQTPWMYGTFVVLYSAALGMCYATFTAFVLDIIGHTGGATKYNMFASLANLPIYAMGLIDGWAATKYGRVNMLWVDGAAGVLGAVVLMSVVFVLRWRKADPPPAT